MKTLTHISPQLTLVGAGPGDPELITLKGIRAVRKADVILYDALIHPDILLHASAKAIKVFVGKRAGQHSFTQDEIHRLIAEYALNKGHVVRLKGGDPFVFGRGHEELEFAESLGIPTRIIPGISSSIAVPELQGIPITRRGTNESFWVITGTTRSGKLSSDVALAAQSSATVIILMGMSKLREIRETFEKLGKKNTPFAIIQNGTLANEKTGFGYLHQIEDIAKKNQLGAPAIIVIGEVVLDHKIFRQEVLHKHYFKSRIAEN